MDERPAEDEDRVLLKLDAVGPMELTGLTESFAALARFFERHYRPEGSSEAAPKLFVTRLQTGSIIAEIAPYAVILGQAYAAMGGAVTVGDFVKRLADGLKAFAGLPTGVAETETPQVVSRDDAADLQAFIKPLTGKNGASLGIKHAKFKSKDGSRETTVEYIFDERELNRAAVNIEKALLGEIALLPPEAENSKIHREVMLFFHQASRAPGKEQGRTNDKAVIPELSDKPLPTYFRSGIQDLKELMVRGEDNPLRNVAFVVDVSVQSVDGQPRAYIVTDVHRRMELD